jgi:catechol 2,3-dioxygenase-like lactoylglutathione lyase family enzyme
MQAKFVSVMVDDQEKALKFYTEKLGFAKMADIAMGDYRWLTVTPPDGPEGVEVVLEPTAFPPAKVYQKALLAAGIPITAFTTRDVRADFERLKARGVVFRGEPVDSGPVVLAVFEDTCGNLVHLAQPKS